MAFCSVWADRRFRLGRGKVFALYVALYGFGRFFTEGIRLDFSYDTFGPIRFNQAVAGADLPGRRGVFWWLVKNRPGREESVYLPGHEPVVDAEPTALGDEDSTDADPAKGDVADGEAAQIDTDAGHSDPAPNDGADTDADREGLSSRRPRGRRQRGHRQGGQRRRSIRRSRGEPDAEPQPARYDDQPVNERRPGRWRL